MNSGRAGNEQNAIGTARNKMVWLLVAVLLCLSTPAWATEMVTNGGFDTAANWAFGGTGAPSYSTAQNNGVLTGAGSFLQDTTGRNKTWTGTASQAVSVISGGVINAATDISLYGMEEFFIGSADATVTIDLRYQDATSVQVFSGTVSANSSWSQITNNTATAFPLNLSQNVNQITVSVAATTTGSDKNAYSHVYVDDIVITYSAATTDNLTATSSVNVSTTAQPGQTDTQMMYIQLNSDAVGNGNCIVTDVTINDPYVSAIGTISNVQIHIDDNNNFLDGTLGSNSTGAWDGSSTLVDLTGITEDPNRIIYAGTPKFIWVLYDIDAGSATGIQAQVQVSDIGVLAPDNAPISGPWDSNIIDINIGLGCGGCHPNPMVDGASRNPADGGVEGDHTKHATAQGYECTLCHLAVSANPRHRDTFITMTETIGTITNAAYTTTGKSGVVTDPGVSVQWPQNTVPVRGNCRNTNCHGGINSAGDYGGPTGAGPQWGTTNADTCTFCHNADQTNSGGLANAYPSAASPFRSTNAAAAHAQHMASTITSVACADCHTVPAAITDVGHMDELGVPPYTEAPADVPFPAGSDALLNTSSPSYAAYVCTNVYCHGAKMPKGDDTGSFLAPDWDTDDWANYPTGCTAACHGLPPKTGSSSSTGQHAGVTAGDVTACKSCHGSTATTTDNPPVMDTTYHINGTVEATGCTGCHGSDPKQYPPLSAAGAPANSGSDDAIGAHVLHIESTSALMSKENIEGTLVDDWCAECHTTTRGAGGHDDAYPAEVVFTNAVESAYGSVTEAFTADGSIDDGIAGSCVTYCHTAFEGVANTAGINTQPKWSDDWSNYETNSACSTACHLTPPTTSAHGSVLANDLTACNTCHADTVTDTAAMPTIAPAFHINGSVESTGCTGCHGTDPKEYPPLRAEEIPARGTDGVGAHVVHIEKTAALMTKENIEGTLVNDWCAECHTTTRGAASHDDAYPAEVSFGNAVESGYGSVTEGFSPATGGSSGSDDGIGGTCVTYCHNGSIGGSDPRWTDDWVNNYADGGAGSCNSNCHGLPPATGDHASAPYPASCSGCHPDTVTSTTDPVTIVPSFHINGTIEKLVSCTGCHNGGGPTAKLVSVDSPHSTTDTGMTCEECHFADHPSRTTGTVGITWYAQTMGTDYTVDGKVYIKANGASNEAEACWTCHEGQDPDVSEWDGSSAVYNYGKVSTDDLNWFTTFWSSANFNYKNGPLTDGMGTRQASSHGTNGGAQGVDQESEIGCTRCHDVHGINNNGVSTTSAPYLRGSWKASAYYEDGAPGEYNSSGGGSGTGTYVDAGEKYGLVPRGSAATNNGMGGYWIDQNSGSPANGTYATHAGLCTLCHGDGDSIPAEAADVVAVESAWIGHKNSVAGGNDDGSATRNIFSNTIRIGDGVWNSNGGGAYMGNLSFVTPRNTKPYAGSIRNADYGDGVSPTVNGKALAFNNFAWGVTVDDNSVDSNFHSFSCSKCHNPHASRLPRLMITNCLDTSQNTWAGSFTGDGNWGNNNYSTQTYGTNELSKASTAQNCHRYISGQETSGWNIVTPW